MLVLALRQARSTAGRLVLAGVAVALGTGFVAAVLLTSTLFTRTVEASVAARYTGADVVATVGASPFTDAQVAAVAAAPGVAAAEGRVQGGVQLLGASRSQYVDLTGRSSVPALAATDRGTLLRGELPDTPGQVAVSASTAERLGVGLGEGLRVQYVPPVAPPEDPAAPTSDDAATLPGTAEVPVTVVGLLSDGPDRVLGATGRAVADPADALAWGGSQYTDDAGRPLTGYGTLLAVAAPGTTDVQARDAVAAALTASGAPVANGDAQVQTVQQLVSEAVDGLSGGTNVLTGAALAFGVLALFVAATVIGNTFSVLVAQRTRQLALLRCVGATKRQVRGSVLAEAAVLGLAASAVGVAGGVGLAVLAAELVGRSVGDGVPLPAAVALTPTAVVVPLVLGVLATVASALAPARAATRVSPLEALRPAAAPDLRRGGSRLRLVASCLLVGGGLVLLAGGTLLATGGPGAGVDGPQVLPDGLVMAGLPAAVLGGMLSFTGVLVGAVFVVPRVVSALGALLGRAGGGAPARLAALGAVRDPRRTASTTAALLIGTTLVALMTVGAASASRTLSAVLDREHPVDAGVSTVRSGDGEVWTGVDPALPPAVLTAAAAAPGVVASVPLLTAEVTTRGGEGMSAQGEVYGLDVVAGDPAALRGVLVDPAAVTGLAPGTVVLPEHTAERVGVTDGDVLTLTALGQDGAAAPASRDLRVVVGALGGTQAVLDTADLTALVPSAATSALWLRFDPAADPEAVSADVQDAVSTSAGTTPVQVQGSAAERATYQRVIDTMLLVVVGLLAVAVVIALVGVANTLSLSVIERTRENAVLRALGLTRGQLRAMLATEGALVAGVGGLLGVVLGSLYGWLGAASLLGGLAAEGGGTAWVPALPWGRLGLLLAVAVAAGLLASVLPARRAVRTPPVRSLG